MIAFTVKAEDCQFENNMANYGGSIYLFECTLKYIIVRSQKMYYTEQDPRGEQYLLTLVLTLSYVTVNLLIMQQPSQKMANRIATTYLYSS